MNKNFVKKETAKRLKNLGYKEKVQAYYQEEVDLLIPNMITSPLNGEVIEIITTIDEEGKYPAPTLYEVKDWLEKEHNMFISTTWKRENKALDYSVMFKGMDNQSGCGGFSRTSMPEALESLIDSCLYYLEHEA